MTQKQIELLKEVIDKNLEIRGINVVTTLDFNEETKKFNLTSTNFQTFPVIHFNLHIINFGGGISQNKEHENLTNIYLPVSLRYDGNGEDLFTIRASISTTYDNDLFVDSVIHATR